MTNGRTLDIEIGYLRSALRWAKIRDIIPMNPLADLDVPSFQSGPVVKCREFRPADADELHRIARHLFGSWRSEVLGWQMLFEAYLGLRTGEALMLRFDAERGKPGHVDGDVLHLDRLKKGVNPWAMLHPAAKELLEAHRKWQSDRFNSDWYFPSPDLTCQPVGKSSLSHALIRVTKALGIGRRTAHGMRAYYVTVRRSQGIPDAQIAAEIGDATGAQIITSTYGDLPPNWSSSTAGKLDWTPKGEPAWKIFK